MRPLPNTGAPATVRAMKNIMGENGVPVKIISDNGVHFTASEFSAFAKQYGFEIILSSPRYAQGHALIERHVQTIERCMMKCMANGQDFDLALLALRATPLDATLQSPAEILNGRKYRTTVPAMPSADVARKHTNTRKRLQTKQQVSASYYNRSIKDKTELIPGQCVRLFDLKRKVWEPATITGIADTPRSYIVQRLEGGMPLRRNRIHIKTTKERWNTYAPTNRIDGETTSPPSGDAAVVATRRVNSSDGQSVSLADQDHQLAQGKRTRRQTVFFQAH